MLTKSNAIDRLLRENPNLSKRRFGLPDIGKRLDKEDFNPTVKGIADAIDYYGYEVRDELITTIPDIDLGGGNPIKFKPFPLAVEEIKKSLDREDLHKYPYTEGSDEIRKVLLDYVESLGFINDHPYSYDDIDSKGLSVHNITFMPSTSILFNIIINIISKPGDVVIVTGPNYGLFTIRAERAGAEVEVLPLHKEDNFLVNPKKLAQKIDEINDSLQKVYNRRKGYVPRVVAFLNANPNNPTGKVMGEKDVNLLKEISEVCLKRGTFVIDDLVYRDISYDENNIAKPISTIPGMFRNTISLFGLSKSYGLASLRAGFVVADEIIIREIINRIFQEMDSVPDLVGRALMGAFNTSDKRNIVYNEYFRELRDLYKYKYNVLKTLVLGIDKVELKYREKIINTFKNDQDMLNGIPFLNFPENLETEAGFFAIIDFTELKGMQYNGRTIQTERDLLNFFYETSRIRFLVGQSISWPYKDELIGRVTFVLDDDFMIKVFRKIKVAISKLSPKKDYIIRKNELKDQEQMARIKVDGWKTAYDKLIASQYLNSLDYKRQTERYISSFEEYKDLVFVAVKGEEVLGYSCFSLTDRDNFFDSELVSLYIKPTETRKGIGESLVKETAKELVSKGKNNMIVWCLSDNINALNFYKKLGGKKVKEKKTQIGSEKYLEYGIYFDLNELINIK